MIERCRAAAGIYFADRVDRFFNVLSGNETSSEFLEKSKAGCEFLEAFLVREVEQRASR